MELVRVEVRSRTETGKGAARKLRRSGFVPGVVYGMGKEPLPLTVDAETVHKLSRAGHAVLVELSVDGTAPEEGVAAIVKSVDRHPVTWEPLAVDFQWVSLTETVDVPVPVVTVGEPRGVAEQGGILEQHMHEVTIRCLPTEIPEALELDVSELMIGDSLHVRDLKVPEGVEILEDEDETVVSIAAPRVVEEEEEAEAAEEVAEELAEGEEAEGEAEEAEGAEEEEGEE